MNRARRWRNGVVATVAIAAAAAVSVTATDSPARAATDVAVQNVANQSQTIQPVGLVALPVLNTQQVPTQQGDSLVYRNAAPDTSFVIRPTANGGGQTLINITGNKAPTSFKFAMPLPAGAHYKLQPNGSINVETVTGQVIGIIGSPWAKDTCGKAVATHYTIQGNEIVQTVAYHGAAFPVVADPSVHWHWWGVEIDLSKGETNAVAWGTGALSVYLGWTGWAGVAALAIIWTAQWAATHGYCLSVSFEYTNWRWPVPGTYRC